MNKNMPDVEKRPEELEGKTIKMKSGCGNMYVTINSSEHYPIFEIFSNSGKTGSCSSAVVDALNTTISISLRAGIQPNEIIERLDRISCPKSEDEKVSCPEGIAKAMKRYLQDEYDLENTDEIVEVGDSSSISNDESANEASSDQENFSHINEDTVSEDIHAETINSSGFEECPECGEEAFNPTAEGCSICVDCGYSPCD